MNKIIDNAIASLKNKKSYIVDLEKESEDNINYRKVLYTGSKIQLVVMSLMPDEEVGMEEHPSEQFFRVEEGEGTCIIDGKKYKLEEGTGVVVPPNSKHNIINDSGDLLKLYIVYSPAIHEDGLVEKNKTED